MSLLDDARRLTETGGIGLLADRDGPFRGCFECGMTEGDGHAPDCPWHALPRIIAALEAAEQIVRTDPFVCHMDWQGTYTLCWVCMPQPDEPHKPDCPRQALVAALRGEGAPA